MVGGLLIVEASSSGCCLLRWRSLVSLEALVLPLVLLTRLDQADEPLQLALDSGSGGLCLTSGGRRWVRKALSLPTRLPSAARLH